jgi:hypothetical protein
LAKRKTTGREEKGRYVACVRILCGHSLFR